MYGEKKIDSCIRRNDKKDAQNDKIEKKIDSCIRRNDKKDAQNDKKR